MNLCTYLECSGSTLSLACHLRYTRKARREDSAAKPIAAADATAGVFKGTKSELSSWIPPSNVPGDNENAVVGVVVVDVVVGVVIVDVVVGVVVVDVVVGVVVVDVVVVGVIVVDVV